MPIDHYDVEVAQEAAETGASVRGIGMDMPQEGATSTPAHLNVISSLPTLGFTKAHLYQTLNLPRVLEQ